MMSTMKRPYQIAGGVLLLFSAFVVREATELQYYASTGPGPGFFPFWLGVVIAILAGTMLFQATFQESPSMPADFYGSSFGHRRALAIIASGVWVVFFMNRLGFRITMAVFFLWLLLSLGRVQWYWILLVTALGSWGAFWLFNDLLKVVMPLGPWGF